MSDLQTFLEETGLELTPFQRWFLDLYDFARRRGNAWLIAIDDPESYLDYYEDGDSPIETYVNELSHALGGELEYAEQ